MAIDYKIKKIRETPNGMLADIAIYDGATTTEPETTVDRKTGKVITKMVRKYRRSKLLEIKRDIDILKLNQYLR